MTFFNMLILTDITYIFNIKLRIYYIDKIIYIIYTNFVKNELIIICCFFMSNMLYFNCRQEKINACKPLINRKVEIVVMKIITVGRQTEVTQDLKDLFDKKLKKFDKFFNEDAVASIKLSKIKNKERLELTISNNGTLFRSEQTSDTFNNALDIALENIERQIRKNKTRLEKRLREGAFLKAEGRFEDDVEAEETIIRTKAFEMIPMSPEEAILQMNLLGHQFYMFHNSETNETNVVYKRNDGNYGLITKA